MFDPLLPLLIPQTPNKSRKMAFRLVVEHVSSNIQAFGKINRRVFHHIRTFPEGPMFDASGVRTSRRTRHAEARDGEAVDSAAHTGKSHSECRIARARALRDPARNEHTLARPTLRTRNPHQSRYGRARSASHRRHDGCRPRGA